MGDEKRGRIDLIIFIFLGDFYFSVYLFFFESLDKLFGLIDLGS